MGPFTQEQIQTLNNLFRTEPILSIFNTDLGRMGLGDLVVAIQVENLKQDEDNRRYSFMLG